MRNNCIECPLCRIRRNTFYCGKGNVGERGDMTFDIIARFEDLSEIKEVPSPDWCPLKDEILGE